MPDEAGESRCVRWDCAILEPESANATVNTVVSFVNNFIVNSIHENLYLARIILPSLTLMALGRAFLSNKGSSSTPYNTG
jgi:hypothetical protein